MPGAIAMIIDSEPTIATRGTVIVTATATTIAIATGIATGIETTKRHRKATGIAIRKPAPKATGIASSRSDEIPSACRTGL